MKIFQKLNEEDGVELIEFIGVMPLVFIIIFIGWQFFLAGHTIVTGIHAAREGARAAAVCGNYEEAVKRASPGYSPVVIPITKGKAVGVRATYKVPMLKIPYVLTDRHKIELPFEATMRKERCS